MRVTRIGVDVDGRAQVEEARATIDTATALVTAMHSNNETGVLQPIAEFAELAHSAGAILHTDAAQSVGKVPLEGCRAVRPTPDGKHVILGACLDQVTRLIELALARFEARRALETQR